MAADPQARFERALLASARGDAGPRDVGAAWSRFAGALDRAAVGRDDEARGSDATAPPRAPLTSPAPVASSGRILTWLVIGALGGAGATVAIRARDVAPLPRTEVVTTPLQVAPEPAAAPVVTRPKADGEAAILPPRARPLTRRRAASRQPGDPSASSSRLAAEVRRIDGARSANSRGDHDEAIRLVDAYHARFPGGLLAADADIVALEAAAADHGPVEVRRRAALFLSRYPRDPHAAMVRRIAADAALETSPGDE